MKISKKVVIKRNPEQVWSCLTNIKSKKSAKNSANQFEVNAVIKLKGHDGKWQITGLSKSRKLKLHRENKGQDVDIDIKLTPMKTRTEVKLTLTGWENADTQTQKTDIPKTSLNWEKTIMRLKKEAESK